jgi:hypothetical protein
MRADVEADALARQLLPHPISDATRGTAMPIRTDRGRAVIYRRIWGWPLRSPRRLALAAVVAAVAAVGIALLTSVGSSHDPRPAPERTGAPAQQIPVGGLSPTQRRPPPPTSARAGPVAATSAAPTPVSPPSTVAASSDATQTARTFAERWVTHPPGTTSQHWAAQLAPLVVPEYLATLESVDPSGIPANRVTGDPTVHPSSPTVAEATVPTDAGALRLVLLGQPDGTWRVRSYDRAAS